uniref:Uncharacterized protein n=1 Tax=viral metagenome TaxID=1070528 RepID=A0A6C0LE47_9ZZZZ
MIGILLLTSILVIITICLLFCNLSSFKKVSNFKTVPTVKELKIEQDEFLDAYNKVKKRQEEQDINEIPFTWNPNNTLESMRLQPCLSDVDGSAAPGRLTCFAAPAWWYPENKYKQDNFRVTYYGDMFNPIYNYLGNAQEMFWDFKSVKDTFSII